MKKDYDEYISNKLKQNGILDDTDPVAWFALDDYDRSSIIDLNYRHGQISTKFFDNTNSSILAVDLGNMFSSNYYALIMSRIILICSILDSLVIQAQGHLAARNYADYERKFVNTTIKSSVYSHENMLLLNICYSSSITRKKLFSSVKNRLS
jgi:hypothetical protein